MFISKMKSPINDVFFYQLIILNEPYFIFLK